MAVSAVLYDWAIRLTCLQRRADLTKIRSRIPRLRKFLLFKQDDQLTLVVGPALIGPMEYHHYLLRHQYIGENDSQWCGGGMLFAECDVDGAYLVRLAFWRNGLFGSYNDELVGLEDELGSLLGCRISVTQE